MYQPIDTRIGRGCHVIVRSKRNKEKEKIFYRRAIINKNNLWRSFILTDQDKMKNLYKGPCIEVCFCRIMFALANRCQ